jgi:hypothetical protein
LGVAVGTAVAVVCAAAVGLTTAIVVSPARGPAIGPGATASPVGATTPLAGSGGLPAGPPGGGLPGPGPGLPPYGLGAAGAAGPFGGPGPPPLSALPSPGPGGAPHGCYSLPLRTPATVVDGPGAAASGIRLTDAAYTYYPAWNPSVAVGGRLSGPPPGGRRLIGADWSDPATRDSTPARNPGNGRYFPGSELTLTNQRCFTVPPFNLSYGGYTGITTRVYVLLVDPEDVVSLPRAAARLAGLTADELAQNGADILGYFTVPAGR